MIKTMQTLINKTDTFLLYGEIFCVIDIVEYNDIKKTDPITDEVYYVSYVDYVCENVLDETNVITWGESDLLCLFNNPEAFAHE